MGSRGCRRKEKNLIFKINETRNNEMQYCFIKNYTLRIPYRKRCYYLGRYWIMGDWWRKIKDIRQNKYWKNDFRMVEWILITSSILIFQRSSNKWYRFNMFNINRKRIFPFYFRIFWSSSWLYRRQRSFSKLGKRIKKWQKCRCKKKVSSKERSKKKRCCCW
jgi:hypothetical protein